MPRPYEVLIERGAERDLEILPAEQFQRIIARINALREDPRPSGCRKISGSFHDWRLRVGPYRVVYEVDDTARTVTIIKVRLRHAAYR
jgi:mRNA interferase RelE/StbE